MQKFHHSFSVYQNFIEIAVQHIAKSQNNKYIANNAENNFDTDKLLIIS